MILSLGISTPEITLGKDAAKTASLKGLKEGQIVSAKVLGTMSDSRAHLLIGGQKLTADTEVPLTPGQEISLKLTREKGQLSFKLIQSSPQGSTGDGSASTKGPGILAQEITLGKEAVNAPAFKGVKEGQIVGAKVLGMLSDTKAQLLIGGEKLTAETGQPLAPGQEISMKLVQKGLLSFRLVQSPSQQDSTPMAGRSSAAVPDNAMLSEITLSKEAANGLSLKGLKGGEHPVSAKVLGMVSDTKARLLIHGQKLTAGTSQPLTPGQEISMKLVQEKDFLTFKLIPPSGIREGISLARIDESMLSFEKLGQAPGKPLGNILETLALKSGERDEGFVPRLLNNSGIRLEQKVATLLVSADGTKLNSAMQKLAGEDLKAALLQLISRDAEGDASPAGKSPSTALARTVTSALEHFQSLNTQPSESQRFILPFPVMAGDQFNFGQLFLDTGKKEEGKDGESGNRVIRLAFLLNMTSLGDLRADFSILNKSIAGRFLLADQPTCDYMKSLMPVLGQRLSAVGFQMGRVDCAVAEPRQLSPGALIQAMTAEREVRGLDLVI